MTQAEQDQDDKLLEAEFNEYESCVVVDRERLRKLFLNDKARKMWRIESIKSNLRKPIELQQVEQEEAEMNEKWSLTKLVFLIALITLVGFKVSSMPTEQSYPYCDSRIGSPRYYMPHQIMQTL